MISFDDGCRALPSKFLSLTSPESDTHFIPNGLRLCARARALAPNRFLFNQSVISGRVVRPITRKKIPSCMYPQTGARETLLSDPNLSAIEIGGNLGAGNWSECFVLLPTRHVNNLFSPIRNVSADGLM